MKLVELIEVISFLNENNGRDNIKCIEYLNCFIAKNSLCNNKNQTFVNELAHKQTIQILYDILINFKNKNLDDVDDNIADLWFFIYSFK